MPDGDIVHTIYVEMKNKHNTMNSASSAKTYIKMQGQILEDDDCACLLVEAIAKKSQNIKWSTKVDGKNVQHRLIRRVSMDQFYAILTGEEDAFYKMCMALPEVINAVVNEEDGVEVPHDTVIDELRKLASLYVDENNELSADYAQPDGLHFTVSGYEHWVDYLCRHTVYSPDNPWLPGSAYAEVTVSAQQNEENAESAAESAQ